MELQTGILVGIGVAIALAFGLILMAKNEGFQRFSLPAKILVMSLGILFVIIMSLLSCFVTTVTLLR